MQVSVETTGNIDRKMTVEVPAEQVTDAVDKRLKNLAKRVKIDGFRPGKVPMSVVRQRYAESTRQEVMGEVLENNFQLAVRQEQLRIAGTPSIESVNMDEGQPLTFTAAFQVYPEFEVADVSGLSLTRPASEVGDADIDKMIDVIREQQKEWVDVDRASAEGDMVRLDFKGTLDGELFEGGSAEDFATEVGAGRMLPDFDAALVGVSAGDEKTIDVAFPEDYQAENLKGKTAQFELRINAVQEAKLPEIDAPFMERFGIEDGSVDAFRAEVKKNMEREMNNAIKSNVKQQVMDGLAELHAFDVPAGLVDSEVGQVREEFLQNSGMGANADQAQLPDELFKPQAERRVKLGLIVGEIIRQHNIERDQSRVDAMLEALAMTYEDPMALIEYYRSNPQAMQTIEAAAMEELIVDWVMEKATVTDEQRPFEEVMGRSNPTADAESESEQSVA